jgi:hypothetical protein
MNSARLRHSESGVYASATRSGSRVFHAISAAWTFWSAVSSVKGGSGGLVIRRVGEWEMFQCHLAEVFSIPTVFCFRRIETRLIVNSMTIEAPERAAYGT